MGAERRRHIRIEVPMPVTLTHEKLGTLELITADICEGGVFLKADPAQCPGEGEEVTLQVKGGILGGDEAPPQVKARVVRQTPNGIGVEFL
ncbi:MAG: PilZ domain-containing protein [Pseudomonadota bacterium]